MSSPTNPDRPLNKQNKGVWDASEAYSETQEGYYRMNGPTQGVAFGINPAGQLGLNNRTNYSSAVMIHGGDNDWESIQNVGGSCRGVKRDGSMWTWGSNNYGELGLNERGNFVSSPTQLYGGGNWMPIMDTCRLHTAYNTYAGFGIKQGFGAESPWNNRKLFVWGTNYYGKMGQGESPQSKKGYSSPVQIPGYWYKTSGGGTGGPFCAINKIGELFTWGDQSVGGLGQNETWSPTKRGKSSPSQVEGGGTWKDVASGGSLGVGLKADGTTWGWGANGSGTLGINDTVNYSSPVLMPGNNWKKVATATGGIVARINEDNELWVQGAGNPGFLMQNSNVSYSSPIQIPGSWQDFYVASSENAYALKTNGELWCTGRNAYGSMGPNAEIQPESYTYSSPIQIPGNWKECGPAGHSFMGIKWGNANDPA